MAGSSKGKMRRKAWYEIYWPDSTKSIANNFKGSLNAIRVASPADGKRTFAQLEEQQAEFLRTGIMGDALKMLHSKRSGTPSK